MVLYLDNALLFLAGFTGALFIVAVGFWLAFRGMDVEDLLRELCAVAYLILLLLSFCFLFHVEPLTVLFIACSTGYLLYLGVMLFKWVRVLKVKLEAKEANRLLRHCEKTLATTRWHYNYPKQVSLKPGWAFEFFIKDVFEACGFDNVQEINNDLTIGGDHGADLVATFGVKRCVIQCKHRAKAPVGPKDVREILAAKYHYQASCCIIVTSTSFSSESYNIAKNLNVELLDRKSLRKAIRLRGRTFRSYKGLRFRDQLNPFDSLNMHFRIPPSYVAGKKEDAVCKKDLEAYRCWVLQKANLGGFDIETSATTNPKRS